MQLRSLLENYQGFPISINGLASDSRKVIAGNLFIVLPSLTGKSSSPFIKQALEKGASAVLASAEICEEYNKSPIPFIPISNPRKTLAELAVQFYKNRPETLIAVTGTNGKSSVVEFTRQFWEAAQLKAVSIGSLGVTGPQGVKLEKESLTSPDTLHLYHLLEELENKGFTHAALEASSHGLHQYRLHGLPLKAGAFTNLSQDHLDYHKTMTAYFEAKSKLFSKVLPEGATAVLNADSDYYPSLKKICLNHKLSILSYGYQGDSLKLLSVSPLSEGQKIRVRFFKEDHELLFPLMGEFQIMNALCAVGLALATGVPSPLLIAHLRHLKSVTGRLELIGMTVNHAQVFVDYAHTPDALKHVLKTLRPHVKNNLKVIFGCGGDRDKLKRPLMGKVAAEFADSVFITDDNPRTEDATEIRQAILKDCSKAQEIPNRETAIKVGINSLETGDILVVAGKGHEQGQTIGQLTYPFEDAEVIKKYLKENQTL